MWWWDQITVMLQDLRTEVAGLRRDVRTLTDLVQASTPKLSPQQQAQVDAIYQQAAATGRKIDDALK